MLDSFPECVQNTFRSVRLRNKGLKQNWNKTPLATRRLPQSLAVRTAWLLTTCQALEFSRSRKTSLSQTAFLGLI